MAFSEKIKLIFDIDDAPGVKSLKNLKKGVSDADGAFGKFKAGASGAMDLVKDNAGAMALAGGAALGAFAIKAVGAFTDTAKAALDLGSATGLSTEQASKWIAVGDDFEVGADQLQGALGKIGKTLDDTKWGKYGIATRDAGGQARSTNDIFLDSLDTLGKITNETERARVGNDLFGKGYANIAPMVGKARSEYEGMLGAVSEGQVITDKEAKKAEKMRLAQDELADAFGDVTLAVGELAASAAPALSVVAKGVETLAHAIGMFQATGLTETIKSTAELKDEAEKLGINTSVLAAKVTAAHGGVDGYNIALTQAIQAHKDQVIAVIAASEATRTLTKEERDDRVALDDAAGAARGLSKDLRDERAATDESTLATNYLNQALGLLNGNLDQRAAVRSFEEAMYTFRSETGHSEESTDTFIGKLRDTTVALDSIPTEVKTQMIAALDAGSYELVESRLSFLARNRNSVISSQIVGADFNNAREGRAAGGPVLPGESYTVGEHGIEVLQMGARGGRIIPNHALGGGSQIVVNIHGPVMGEQDFINRIYDGIIDGQRRGELVGAF
jgi:hypothetical protein